jgi:HAD superfamily hydrolase (TIGR01509 family)
MIGIIFDCDGTLINSEEAYFLSWQKALQLRNGSMPFEEYITYAGHPSAYIAQKLHEKVNVDSPEAIIKDAKKAFQEEHHHVITPIERTLKFVRELSRKKHELGIKLGVASAADKNELLTNLNRFGLIDYFEFIVSGKDDLADYRDPEGVNKPKPYIYLHTAKLLGIDPSRCIAFEDSGPGVLAASRAGMVTFAVPNFFTQKHDFSPAAYTIDSSTEIDVEEFFQNIHASLKNNNKKSSL